MTPPATYESGCTFVWDSLRGEVRVYEEVEDDEIENETSTRWETDVYISKKNLASATPHLVGYRGEKTAIQAIFSCSQR